MLGDRATVVIGYHFDGVAIWLNRYDAMNAPGRISRGLFGVDVAAPRLLDLHDRLDLPATWFIPGQTIESFPGICGEIWERGYDIQHHGWSHASQESFEDKADVQSDMERGIAAIRDLTGRRPTGYSSNRWGVFTNATVELLVELGFEWDSSFMGGDFEPYYVRRDAGVRADGTYDPGEKTDVLEFPVHWRRDDFPHFMMGKALQTVGGATDDRAVFRRWRDMFDYMYDNIENGVFNLTLHPQVIGRAPLPRYLEDLVGYMRSKGGVRFTTFDAIATDYDA